MPPRVSVLMSVHNGSDYVADALSSVLCQTAGDLELIVVDDASTDDTLAILQRERDPRLVVIAQPTNIGLVDALNLAAGRATAPLLARIDADDLWLPGKVEAQLRAFDEDPALVLLGTAFEYIDGNGRAFKQERPHATDPGLSNALQRQGNQLCHASVMMRTDAFDAVGGYRKLAGRYAQDYDLWLRLSERGAVACLSEVLTQYRCHEEMLSITKLPQQRRAAEIYRVLGEQRRAGGSEDLAAAAAEVDASLDQLNDRLAGDYLRWMDLFEAMGRGDFARAMLWRAVRTAPMGAVIRQRVWNSMTWRVRALMAPRGGVQG